MSNRDAFLTMLAASEGTKGHGDDGYNIIVGGQLFTDYSDHPRVMVWLPRLGIHSSAAGRYQILAHEFDYYKKLLNLPDFSPASQDAIALQMIKERHSIPLIDCGNIDQAIIQCSNIWASLPGNNYHQRQNKVSVLEKYFTDAGGTLIVQGVQDVPTIA